MAITHLHLTDRAVLHTSMHCVFVWVLTAVVSAAGGEGGHHQEDILGLRGQTTATATPVSGLRPLLGTTPPTLTNCSLTLSPSLPPFFLSLPLMCGSIWTGGVHSRL